MTRDFDAWWDAATRRGRIRQTCNPYSTDSVLRIVLSALLCRERGFLLHASSVVLDDRAFVFTGLSGAGKTTIASLAPAGAILLTDEISCLRSTPRGWLAHGTPFAGELGTSGERVSAPVAAIFRLEQGGIDRIREMSSAHAVRTLMRNILFFGRDADLRAAVLDSACGIAADIAVSTLTFRNDASVWDVVERQVPAPVRA
jgi:hypothetical protein